MIIEFVVVNIDKKKEKSLKKIKSGKEKIDLYFNLYVKRNILFNGSLMKNKRKKTREPE